MSKIATIEKVLEFTKHPNADTLYLVKILGYQLVTASTYNVGDLVIFIHPDSIIIPEKQSDPRFAFLANKKFRINIIKLRGEFSQGLSLPINEFLTGDKYFEGEEIHEELGVAHYEKALAPQLAGTAKGNFPSFLIKTDEELIKSSPWMLNDFHGKEVYLSVKYDGSSGTFANHEEFLVCSRNLNLKETEGNTFWRLAKEHDLPNTLRKGYAVQGEVYGEGIQKNRLGIKGQQLAIFNLFNIEERRFLSLFDLQLFSQHAKIPMVKVIDQFVFDKEIHTLDWLQEKANALKYPNGANAEGIVIRPIEDCRNSKGGRLSAKIINQNFKEE